MMIFGKEFCNLKDIKPAVMMGGFDAEDFTDLNTYQAIEKVVKHNNHYGSLESWRLG
jgi:hypothetical protein